MNRFTTAAAILLLTAGSASAAIKSSAVSRLNLSADAVKAIREEITDEFWARAQCVLVIPELKKAAFVVGGEYGRGVMSCRAGAQWSAPVFMNLAKGSWGFQIGAEQTDLVLLIMNQSGVQKMLENKVNLGADASIAAGPLGRHGTASTDAAMTAEIVSYSRSKGLFVGIDLSGGVLNPDDETNVNVYGAGATPSTILATREMSAPPEAASFLASLKTPASTSSAPRPMAAAAPVAPRATVTSVIDDDARARVVDIQQSLDRVLADTTPAPMGSGPSVVAGDAPRNTVSVDRGRLLQIRQQLDTLLASLNR